MRGHVGQAHAFGQGSVIWVFISEIFPNRVRAKGQALGSFTHWFFAAVTSWTFPGVAATFGGGAAFLIFLVAGANADADSPVAVGKQGHDHVAHGSC